MAPTAKRTILEKIFENLNFLADVFGDREQDIPDVPLLELALCFELSLPNDSDLSHRSKQWSRW